MYYEQSTDLATFENAPSLLILCGQKAAQEKSLVVFKVSNEGIEPA
jgi:hypothetical protein